VSLTSAVLLLVVFALLGATQANETWRRRSGIVLVAAFLLAALLYLPTWCDGEFALPPFADRGDARPTSCETALGVGLPDLGRFASDTVGWGLAVAANAISIWVGVLAGHRRTVADGPRSADAAGRND